MRVLLLSWLCVVAAVGAQAQQAAPTVILFVGNSFTYGGSTKAHSYNTASVTDEPPGESEVGGIPAIFKKFADESGLHYEVHVETVGGKDLEFHFANAYPLLSRAKWDTVVLQGYSTEPMPVARNGRVDKFVQFAVQMESAIHAARPSTKVYLYQTWPYPYMTYTANPTNPLEPLAAMFEDLRAGYERAFKEDGHFEKIASVGEAWMRMIRSGMATNDPKAPLKPGQIDLWDKDDKHPSVEGSYLAALVLFKEIAGADVSKLGAGEQAAHDLDIPPEVAVKLQTVAAETSATQAHP